jgi:hypothetical protein
MNARRGESLKAILEPGYYKVLEFGMNVGFGCWLQQQLCDLRKVLWFYWPSPFAQLTSQGGSDTGAVRL